MSRRRRSPADDLIDLVAMLPWWAGVALAIAFYVVLHHVAAQQIVASVQPGQVGTMLTQTLWKSLASFGQYVLPMLCLIAAGVSAFGRQKRKSLVSGVMESKAANALDGMSWREFEMLVGEAFRLQRFRVIETGGGGADGGVDLVLLKGGETFLVQCKQWKAFNVGVDVVRELYGAMAAKGATGGFVVTSGRFTADATSFASGRNVKLLDGPVLLGLLRQAQASKSNKASPIPPTPPAQAPKTMDTIAAPACPICSRSMNQRTAKRGANAGNEFWGCTGYPVCRGTRPID